MKKYKIYVADKNKKNLMRLPILPEEMPTRSTSVTTDTFKAANGKAYTIIGAQEPETLTVEFDAPDKANKKYDSKCTGAQFEKFFKDKIKKKAPIYYMAIKPNGKYYIKGLYAISSYDRHISQTNKWIFSITLQKWRKY